MGNVHMFPDDENGRVLQRMQESGDDLSKPRDIDFTVIFPNNAAAQSFARQLNAIGYRVSSVESKVVAALPWDVRVVRHMLPTHAGITEFEGQLQQLASPLGGRNDGWGCFEQ